MTYQLMMAIGQTTHQAPSTKHETGKQSPIQEQLTTSLMNAQPHLMMLVGFLLLLGLSFVYLTNVWLIVFAGILLAVLILSLADMIKKSPSLVMDLPSCLINCP